MDYILIGFGIAIYLDMTAMYQSWHSGFYSKEQFLMQVALILLIPVVGALLILLFTVQQKRAANRYLRKHPAGSRMLDLIFLGFVIPGRGYTDSVENSGVDVSAGSSGDGGGSD